VSNWGKFSALYLNQILYSAWGRWQTLIRNTAILFRTDLFSDVRWKDASSVAFVQPLSHKSARGTVLNYRVHLVSQGRSSKRLFPAGDVTSLNISSLSSDKEYFLTIDASTQAGYNDSLHLQTIYIPRAAEGLFFLDFLFICWLVWVITSVFSTNMAISETIVHL